MIYAYWLVKVVRVAYIIEMICTRYVLRVKFIKFFCLRMWFDFSLTNFEIFCSKYAYLFSCFCQICFTFCFILFCWDLFFKMIDFKKNIIFRCSQSKKNMNPQHEFINCPHTTYIHLKKQTWIQFLLRFVFQNVLFVF